MSASSPPSAAERSAISCRRPSLLDRGLQLRLVGVRRSARSVLDRMAVPQRAEGVLYLDALGAALFAIAATSKVLGAHRLGASRGSDGRAHRRSAVGLIRDVLAGRQTLLMGRDIYATPIVFGAPCSSCSAPCAGLPLHRSRRHGVDLRRAGAGDPSASADAAVAHRARRGVAGAEIGGIDPSGPATRPEFSQPAVQVQCWDDSL